MHRPPPGSIVTVSTQSESFGAFVPAPLPPMPPIQWSAGLRRSFDDALVALGRLDAVSSMLPNAQRGWVARALATHSSCRRRPSSAPAARPRLAGTETPAESWVPAMPLRWTGSFSR